MANVIIGVSPKFTAICTRASRSVQSVGSGVEGSGQGSGSPHPIIGVFTYFVLCLIIDSTLATAVGSLTFVWSNEESDNVIPDAYCDVSVHCFLIVTVIVVELLSDGLSSPLHNAL